MATVSMDNPHLSSKSQVRIVNRLTQKRGTFRIDQHSLIFTGSSQDWNKMAASLEKDSSGVVFLTDSSKQIGTRAVKICGVMWRNGRAFSSEPRAPGFEPCHVTDLVPLGKALNTTFLDGGLANPISYD
ncbi:hypothetical protein Bbelb_246360 [Branchiostoma belcheri]|nr:hypothetical protein Bbelb_246360 [Branchiostoma belcheri]